MNYLKLLQCNKKIDVNVNDTTKLNYVYISNVVTAFEIILEKGSSKHTYEILDKQKGYYTDTEIAELLVKFYKKTDKYSEWINYLNVSANFDGHLYPADNNRLGKLGWKITTTALQGIKEIADTFDETTCDCDCNCK